MRFAESNVVPTRVGVDRVYGLPLTKNLCCPHARGGGPVVESELALTSELSPRAWGWTDVCPPRRT